MRLSAQVGEHVHEVTVDRENGHYIVTIDGTRHEVDAQQLNGDFLTILNGDRSYEVSVETKRDGYYVRHGAAEQLVTLSDAGRRARQALQAQSGAKPIVSAMPGKVVRVLVRVGDRVEQGQGLLVIEAMKMENEIASPGPGEVKTVAVEAGQTVEGGTLLIVVE